MTRPLIWLLGYATLAGLVGCGTDAKEDEIDVAFGQLSTAPTAPSAGAPFSLRFSIRNKGGNDARQVVWRLARDGVFLSQDTVALVGGGRESELQGLTLVEPAPGTHTYEIVLDPGNTLPESDEGNNRALLTVSIAPSGAG